MSAADKFDAIVLGAGFAGITAARDLADEGHSVVLLEAADRIGGRTFTREFKGRSDLIELGGGWINQELQPNMRREVERYGPAIKVDEAVENVVFRIGDELRGSPVPASAIRDLERAWLHLYDAAKRITVTEPIHDQPVRDLDISVAEFFAPLELSRPAQEFVESNFRWHAGADARIASMLPMVAWCAGFGNSPWGFFGGIEERFVDGTRDLLARMIAGSDFELRLEEQAVSIAQENQEVRVVTAAGSVLTAGACVVAVPSNVIRHLDFEPGLSAEKREVVKTNHPVTGFKVTALVEGVSDSPYAIGTGTFHTVLSGHALAAGQALLIGFGTESIASLDLHDLDAVGAAFREYFPGARVLACDAHDWNRDPLFDGGWRIDRAGLAYDFPRIMGEPDGKIFFAGTDMEPFVWRGWMEGAVSTGHTAARGAGELLGVPAKT